MPLRSRDKSLLRAPIRASVAIACTSILVAGCAVSGGGIGPPGGGVSLPGGGSSGGSSGGSMGGSSGGSMGGSMGGSSGGSSGGSMGGSSGGSSGGGASGGQVGGMGGMEGVGIPGDGGAGGSECTDGGVTGGGIGGGMGCDSDGGAGGVGRFPGGDPEAAEQLGKELDKSLGDFDESLGQEQREISSTGRNTEGFDTGSGGNRGGSISLGEQAAGAMSGGGSGGSQSGMGEDARSAAGEVGGVGSLDAQEVAKRTPDDIEAVIDDDVVAKQIREAALAEDDPELRERYWEEYRKYKGMSSPGD